MENSFVHLQVHSEYSILDGIVRIKPLVAALGEQHMRAVAITDHNNLFAAVKFYRAARQAGIKPILGADVTIADEQQQTKVTLLCQNNQGYLNLMALLSSAYQHHQINGQPCIPKSILTHSLCEGLILLTGMTSDIGAALINGDALSADKMANQWQQLFPDRFYLALSRTQRPNETQYIDTALVLAQNKHIPVVATNDVRFLNETDFQAHEARVCIYQGRLLHDNNRPRIYSPQQYLRSTTQMQTLFADIPSAIANSVEIVKRCNVTLTLGKNYLPNFPVPNGGDIKLFFEKQAQIGLQKRLSIVKDKDLQVYEARLKRELDVINCMGFAGYFLIVADFIEWARNNGVPVGPGRGSGAGSLVAYALGITDLDPLDYDLLFERFLNPERVSMPDFDIDFCMDGRDKVIDYVAKRYGRDSVSQIITYGTMAAKAVVRDVGRVLGFPYGYVDKIAKLIPFELGMTLEKALAQEEALREYYAQDKEGRTLLDLAMKLEGTTRNVGKHAGGVVIAPSKLTDFAPLYCEPNGDNVVTQFDKDDVEAVGLVKFDFLGLRTLTIIDWTVQTINAKRKQDNQPVFDINNITLDDKVAFVLLQACHTTAVFQLESRGMKELIKRLVPDCFEEIIALVALFRPGPLQSGMVDDFIDRKHGRAVVEYPHPDLEPILNTTYGVILYQEQVMQIAQVLAGYTLGAADMLRRAMGKKKPEEMAKQRSIFLSGAEKRGVDKTTATHIFDLMEKFAGYGFNKSHSAAYALLSYQTAWLKAHYPSEFMAAVLSSDMDNTDKVVVLINECQQQKISVSSPDINQGQYRFTVDPNAHIVYGLGAIKGVGEGAIEHIVKMREKAGHFIDLFDFCRKIELGQVNRRTLEALIRAGAMDVLGTHRAALLATLEKALQTAEQDARDSEAGQMDLFALDEPILQTQNTYLDAPVWSDRVRLQAEKDSLGHYMSGHPLKGYAKELRHFNVTTLTQLQSRRNQSTSVAGIITGVRTMQTKRGDRMAVITLSDQHAALDVTVFSDVYQTVRDNLTKDNLVIVKGEVGIDDYTGGYRIRATNIATIAQMRERQAHYLQVCLTQNDEPNTIEQVKACLQPFCGGRCPVRIQYQRKEAKTAFMLDQAWHIHPNDDLIAQLQGLLGDERVGVYYGTN